MPAPSSILIIKLRHHGDVLLTTPVARILKSHFPHCSIDVLVYEGTGGLLEENPDIDQVWNLKRIKGWKKYGHQARLLRKLASRRYDWVLHLSDQMQGAYFAKFLARYESVGIDYPKRRNFLWRFCFTKIAPFFESNTHHTIEQNLTPLSVLGIPIKDEEVLCRLPVTQEGCSRIEGFLNENAIKKPYLVVHPAARWFFKCWEDDRFAQVIVHFANQGWPVIVTSSPDKEEKDLVQAILQKTNSPNIISLAGKLTLQELAALIQGARVFVGVDSVPMHMAAALGKDTVALFGPSKLKEWHPWKTRYRLIDARHYGSLIHPDEVDTKTHQRYLSHIPVAPVIEAVEELLKEK